MVRNCAQVETIGNLKVILLILPAYPAVTLQYTASASWLTYLPISRWWGAIETPASPARPAVSRVLLHWHYRTCLPVQSLVGYTATDCAPGAGQEDGYGAGGGRGRGGGRGAGGRGRDEGGVGMLSILKWSTAYGSLPLLTVTQPGTVLAHRYMGSA